MNTNRPIDLMPIFRSIAKHRKRFFIGIPTAFILSCMIIVCVPRYYVCNVSLAPETMNVGSSSLSSVASSFGVNLSSKLGDMTDAFYPEIYPDILNTTSFRLKLVSIPVKTKDGKVKTDYYTYMSNYQKSAWWSKMFMAIGSIFQNKDNDGKNETTGKGITPFMLTKKQNDILNAIGGNINCSVDKRTQIISIVVKDQDPLVCATMADSVRSNLQKFITDYRTSKARADMRYTLSLYVAAKKQYEKARQRYAAYSDSNVDAILTSVNSKINDYENEMQLQYNNYSMLASQYQSAVAKVQEKTPAFTILQPASVPLKPAGPKRMIFVLITTSLTFIGLTIHSVVKDQKESN